MVLSLSRTTSKSTLAWRRIYSEEDPTINRSNALSPVAPTIICLLYTSLHYRVITGTGLTTADELLYPASLPYVEDLISYHAIGARSVEDQEHRLSLIHI